MGLLNMLTDSTDERFMRQALKLAMKAYERDDVPIGCVIVKDNRIIAKGYNRRTADGNVLSHAEILAIYDACRREKDWRLEECTLYVTLEPCQMCAGAIVQARIPRVVIGAMNPKAGCCGSVINLLNNPHFNHQAEITTGVLGEECSSILKDFFADLRDMQKARENFNETRADGMPTDSYKAERVEAEVEEDDGRSYGGGRFFEDSDDLPIDYDSGQDAAPVPGPGSQRELPGGSDFPRLFQRD